MSPHRPVVRARDLARVARYLGFVLDRQKGSHAVFYREADDVRIVIPMHAGKDLKPKTLAGIIADMGLTEDELRRLL